MNKIKIAIIGCGYWGPNLIRNLVDQESVEVAILCDLDRKRLESQKKKYPHLKITTRAESFLLDNHEIDAVVIVTPPKTHFTLAKKALMAGKHVFVEKPLTTSGRDAQELVNLAGEGKKVLMVGHTFLYNLAVRKIKEYLEKKSLGKIYYLYSQRLNLGIIRSDVNALWNFGPHDISIMLYLLGIRPKSVVAWGLNFLQKGIEDVVFLKLNFPGGIGAHIHLSWLDPQKTRKVVIVGSKKMLVFDDTDLDAPIKIFDSGVERRPQVYPHLKFENFAGFQLLTRAGDLLVPKIALKEPLFLECQDFIESIKTGQKPVSSGEQGLTVVKVLEAAQRSLQENGKVTNV